MRSDSSFRRSGFTLVEMLVTMMVMLIMVLAMSQMFALIGRHVTDGRALIELQGQLRTTAYRVQEDLDGLTILARSSPNLDWEVGYFEYIEGIDLDPARAPYTVGNDFDPWWVNDTPTTPLFVQPPNDGTRTAYGDIDDVLMFTARSPTEPFVGRVQGSLLGSTSDTVTISSHDAEIIYWTQWSDGDADGEIDLGEMSLHRRVLLIRPDLPAQFRVQFAGSPPRLTSADLAAFHNRNDLSVHPELGRDAMNNPVIRLVPNTLKDLATRENRTAHLPNIALAANSTVKVITDANFPLIQYFPNRFQRAWLPLHFDDVPASPASPTLGFTGLRAGEDVVQSDLLAFDVRAYDPQAPMRQYTSGGELMTPGDPGWANANAPNGVTVGRGAYVDLGYGILSGQTGSAISIFFPDQPSNKSGYHRNSLVLVNGPNIPFICPIYDTWTWRYEHDGYDQDSGRYTLPQPSPVVEEGTDGMDNDGANGVDDPDERETSPPYVMPLSGLKVTLRAIELDTRQVRQTSVVAEFVPE